MMPGGPRQGPGLWGNKYGARRCSLCSINYPQIERFQFCPVCGEETHFFSNVMMDEDWLNMAVKLAHRWDGEVPDYPPETPEERETDPPQDT